MAQLSRGVSTHRRQARHTGWESATGAPSFRGRINMGGVGDRPERVQATILPRPKTPEGAAPQEKGRGAPFAYLPRKWRPSAGSPPDRSEASLYGDRAHIGAIVVAADRSTGSFPVKRESADRGRPARRWRRPPLRGRVERPFALRLRSALRRPDKYGGIAPRYA